MKSKFKVGDKVRILKENLFGFKRGDEGVVVRSEDDGWIVYVEGRNSSSKFDPNVWITDYDLELITSDKIEVSKTFLLEGYDAACDQWKKRIKEEVPDLFEDEVKLEVGKWYKVKDLQLGCGGFNGLGLATDKSHESGLLSSDEGFNLMQTNGVVWRVNGDFTEAEPSEIKSALVKEAKKRGFKKGASFYLNREFWGPSYGGSKESPNEIFRDEFRFYEGKLLINTENGERGHVIFKDGKWAEIIKEAKVELTLQEIADKFGVSVESLRVKE